MIKILFICLGNICRSPMAEFLLKDMVKKRGIAGDFYIASAATSTYEIGNPVHRGTRAKLAQYGIRAAGKTAVQLTKEDYAKYDYLIGMDTANIRDIMRIIGSDPRHKVYKLLQFACKIKLLFKRNLMGFDASQRGRSLNNSSCDNYISLNIYLQRLAYAGLFYLCNCLKML